MMNRLGIRLAVLVVVGTMLLFAGCQSASVSRSDARAVAQAPEVAQVEVVHIPYDPKFATYVVAIEPFAYSASGLVSGGAGPAEPAVPEGGIFNRVFGGGVQPASVTIDVRQNPHYIGPGIAAQLLTALANSGNIQIVEFQSLKKTRDGGYTCKLEPGEYGPFIIKGIVTEFNETADLSGESKGGSLGGVGAGVGLLGAVTGNEALAYGGAAAAAANPSYSKKDVKRQGMVGMDVKIVKGGNNRIVGAFHSAGTFTTMSSVSGMSIFGIGSANSEFAASAIGQATRQAMNDAVRKITNNLKTKGAR